MEKTSLLLVFDLNLVYFVRQFQILQKNRGAEGEEKGEERRSSGWNGVIEAASAAAGIYGTIYVSAQWPQGKG